MGLAGSDHHDEIELRSRRRPDDRSQPMTMPPGSGAIVMGTGIVSIALALDHAQTPSRIWLGLAAAAWVLLAIAVVFRIFCDRPRLHAEARSPAGLTGVAATAVLGSRLVLIGLRKEAIALLIIAVVMCLSLCPLVLRHKPLPRTGTSFMLTVSVQSLAVLAVAISASGDAPWLIYGALASFALGIALYPFVLARFDQRQLVTGEGDHWVAGGALAISALAASELGLTAARTGTLHGAIPTLHAIAVVIWALSVLWIPALVAFECVAPRPTYNLRRWATVFPVGMYAASSFETARAAHLPLARSFAAVCTWIAVIVWLIVATGMTRRAVAIMRRAIRTARAAHA